jgi:hypothetical protein
VQPVNKDVVEPPTSSPSFQADVERRSWNDDDVADDSHEFVGFPGSAMIRGADLCPPRGICEACPQQDFPSDAGLEDFATCDVAPLISMYSVYELPTLHEV